MTTKQAWMHRVALWLAVAACLLLLSNAVSANYLLEISERKAGGRILAERTYVAWSDCNDYRRWLEFVLYRTNAKPVFITCDKI